MAHFAFVTKSMDDMVKRLQGAGYEITVTGAEYPDRKNVYSIDPDGFEVEFVECLTDQPALPNQY